MVIVTNATARTTWKRPTSPSHKIFSSRTAKRPATKLKIIVNIERKLILNICEAMTVGFSGYAPAKFRCFHSATPELL